MNVYEEISVDKARSLVKEGHSDVVFYSCKNGSLLLANSDDLELLSDYSRTFLKTEKVEAPATETVTYRKVSLEEVPDLAEKETLFFLKDSDGVFVRKSVNANFPLWVLQQQWYVLEENGGE